jgi:hypothetical protein
MKRFALVVIVLALAVPNVVAQTCPTSPGFSCSGGHCWFDWSPDPGCLSTYQMNGDTLSCYSMGAYSPNLQTPAWVRYTFTADDNFSGWTADAFVDFDDPNNSSSNWVDAWAYVTHNSVTTPYHLFYHDGSLGDLGCARPWGSFSAADGDSVMIELSSYRNNSNATIKIGYPNIFDSN